MSEKTWSVNEHGYLDSRAASVLVFHNLYPSGFQSGIEIIHHGERVATCGDLRVLLASGRGAGSPNPGERQIDLEKVSVSVPVALPEAGINYQIRVQAEDSRVRLILDMERPLGRGVVRQAFFQLGLYPPAYFGKTFYLGDTAGVFSLEPNRPITSDGRGSALPIGRGARLIVAAEDPIRKMTIDGVGCELELIDNRAMGSRDWFFVRSQVPFGVTENAVTWVVTPHQVPDWRREPVICVSQVGYYPAQTKCAVIEMAPNSNGVAHASVVRVDPDRGRLQVYSAPIRKWGKFLRYEYGVFDFTAVSAPGVYYIECGGQSAGPFRIAPGVLHEGAWQPTLLSFFPVQMCHTAVWHHGRLWHAACHLDDALQAPTSRQHFDGYAQGPTTDTPYQPYEHIPHLNVGGWHDAGDTDLAAGSQATTTHVLALAREEFGVEIDQTRVCIDERVVEMYVPDSIPDIVQQVSYGAQCLLGGYRAAGHGFCGIIDGLEKPYYQRGEISATTDNLIYDPSLGERERTGDRSGKRDDRWAFTSRDTSLEYQVAAALAASARVLKGQDDELAWECLETAEKAWAYERAHAPVRFECTYVPGHPEAQEAIAAVELLVSTGKAVYRERLVQLLPAIQEHVATVGWAVARVLPTLKDEAFCSAVRAALETHRFRLKEELSSNPFGVPWHPAIWGIGWDIQQFAVRQYYLWRAFPDMFDGEAVVSVVNYVLGCHPGSNTSFVSGVGSRSLTVAFGINRADWSYIAGGVASGTALIRPDFPELKEGYPYFWQQSEYVMPGAATYIFCVLAADAILRE